MAQAALSSSAAVELLVLVAAAEQSNFQRRTVAMA
jgi:hypothetical protein